MSPHRAPGSAPVRIMLDAADVSDIDPRLFGTLVEHMGRCVYTGIYEASHALADEYGFRKDVAAEVSELGVTLARYPGGNFVSGYRWEDGVGERSLRPRRLDLAWRAVETNEVGTDEFLGWTRRMGIEPMMAVNLGTRGIQEAADLVEYCNIPGGTHWSDYRRSNGAATPHDVKLWCLGNEVDGPWQIGHKTAAEYGRLAREAAKAMKLVDPSIEVVLSGSSGPTMPSLGAWEREALEEAFDYTDYVSVHSYYEQFGDDRAGFLASGVVMDRFIARILGVVDGVAARRGSTRRIQLAFDEWNVWYLQNYPGNEKLPFDDSGAAPRIEDDYSLLDAVVVGDLLITLLNNSARVRIACLAQLVNVIAPIRTVPGGGVWRQPTFYPFAETALNSRGVLLGATVDTPSIDTAAGLIPQVSAAAVQARTAETSSMFLVNRASSPIDVSIDAAKLPTIGRAEAHGIEAGDDLRRGEALPADSAVPTRNATLTFDAANVVRMTLPPESWTRLRLSHESSSQTDRFAGASQ